MFVSQRPTLAPFSSFEKSLVALLIIGILLNFYVFFLPYNFIADETGYIHQVLTTVEGEPRGWNIRSFVYPFLLSSGLFLGKWLGLGASADLLMLMRLENWLAAWVAIGLTFWFGRRLYGRQVGLLATVFMVFSWFWILASKRVMMDVPAAMWLLGSLAAAHGAARDERVLLATVLGALAVFTKFQTGPAVVAIGLLLLTAPEAKGRRTRNLIISAATAAVMLAVFAVVDWLSFGRPFSSLINFYAYHFGDVATFQSIYGACLPPWAYLEALPALYSYVFPLLIAAGVVLSLAHWRRSYQPLIVVAAYLLVLHFVCYKDQRYLTMISPYLAIFGSYGVVRLIALGRDLCGRVPAHLSSIRVMVTPGAVAFVVLLLASFVPRNQIDDLFSLKEPCWPFVAKLVAEYRAAVVATVVPCGVPNALVGKQDIRWVNTGINVYTRERARRYFVHALDRYELVILKPNGWHEEYLLNNHSAEFELFAKSVYGTYAAYARRGEAR